MRKKLMLVLLTGVMLISATACGSNAPKSGTNAEELPESVQAVLDGSTDMEGVPASVQAMLEENMNLGDVVGGWESAFDTETSEAAKKVFEEATKDEKDTEYTIITLLGTQVVSGTNYKFLVEAKQGDETKFQVLTVYQDLSGNVEITEVVDVEE